MNNTKKYNNVDCKFIQYLPKKVNCSYHFDSFHILRDSKCFKKVNQLNCNKLLFRADY